MIRVIFFFFKQKTAYEMRISDWSSDVCSSDLQMQRADQWLTGDFLDDVAVYPEPERFGHLIILELIGQHDQMSIRKPLLQFAAIVCSEMVRPIVYDDDVTALLFRTSQWSVQLEIGRANV